MREELLQAIGTIAKTRFLSSEAKKELLLELIDDLIDNTDGPGPDYIIDPILKTLARTLVENLA